MLWQRVIAALVLAPLAIAGVLLLDSRWLGAGLALIMLMALWEWLRMIIPDKLLLRYLALLAYALAVLALWWVDSQQLLLVMVWIGGLWWLLALLWLANYQFASKAGPGPQLLKFVAGGLMVIPAWSAAVLLHGTERGPQWLLYALFVIWAADIFAYFCGRQWGRAKLAPTISPGKTRAGAWGALAGGALIALVGSLIFSLSIYQGALLLLVSMVTVAFSIAGDLFESMIKRHSRIKDSGGLIPGHGGVLDRIDSVCAGLPIFLVCSSVLGL